MHYSLCVTAPNPFYLSGPANTKTWMIVAGHTHCAVPLSRSIAATPSGGIVTDHDPSLAHNKSSGRRPLPAILPTVFQKCPMQRGSAPQRHDGNAAVKDAIFCEVALILAELGACP